MFTGGNSKQGWVLQRGDETVRIFARQGRYRINNSFAVCDAVLAGLGIARLPRLLARNAVASGALQQVLCDWGTPGVMVHAVFPSARFLTLKVRAFIDIAMHAF
jgi:LysR family transcriptional regulator for bpeEF and oprC